MNKLVYSPLVKEKMKKLRTRLVERFGEETSKRVLAGIMKDAEILIEHAHSGTNISDLYHIDTEYWYLFTHHQYLIYRIAPNLITIVQMFREREDFMMKLFGISGRTQESYLFWGE